jgi:hypothetical protein
MQQQQQCEQQQALTRQRREMRAHVVRVRQVQQRVLLRLHPASAQRRVSTAQRRVSTAPRQHSAASAQRGKARTNGGGRFNL